MPNLTSAFTFLPVIESLSLSLEKEFWAEATYESIPPRRILRELSEWRQRIDNIGSGTAAKMSSLNN